MTIQIEWRLRFDCLACNQLDIEIKVLLMQCDIFDCTFLHKLARDNVWKHKRHENDKFLSYFALNFVRDKGIARIDSQSRSFSIGGETGDLVDDLINRRSFSAPLMVAAAIYNAHKNEPASQPVSERTNK